MDYLYERNIAQIKEEYTTFLVNILTPSIYEGIKSLYTHAQQVEREFIESGKHNPRAKSPGVLKIFQISLREVPTLNNNEIERETDRIRSTSKCADWFDDLIRATIKSNIVLLIHSNSKKKQNILKEEHHNKIDIKDFIHKCYIESAKAFYNYPELFWDKFSPLEIKRNQRESFVLIKDAIREAIRRMLPCKDILREYLLNDYYDGNGEESKYMNIKSMVERDLTRVEGRQEIPVDCVLDEDDEDNQDGGAEESSESSVSESNIVGGGDSEDSASSQKELVSTVTEEDAPSSESSGTKEEKETGFMDDLRKQVDTAQQQAELIKSPVAAIKEASLTPPPRNKPVRGEIPKAAFDSEIRRMAENNNVIVTIDNHKSGKSKKEEQHTHQNPIKSEYFKNFLVK